VFDLSHLRVQLIDADPFARLRIAEYLRAAGLEVQAAADATAALAQLRQAAPDVLILDHATPSSRRLVAHCRDVPLLILSSEPNLSEAVSQLGAWAALAKPTDLDVLVAVLKRIAGRRAARPVSTCRGYPPVRRPVAAYRPRRAANRARLAYVS
jgi:DNA-binding response OmpR family regulator